MVDETKTPDSGGGTEAKVSDPSKNAFATTSPANVDGVKAEVTDAEAEALQGSTGPNRVPAFGKKDFEDENVPLTDTDDLQSIKQGSAANSGQLEDMAGLEAAYAAGDLPEGAEDEVQYTSTPIARLKIGPYQFENGVLRLKSDAAEKFEELLAKSAIRTQQVVRKIDRAGGEAVARRYLETTQSRSNRGFDTSDKGPKAPTPGESEPPKQ